MLASALTRRRGLSLAEVLLALGLAALTVLVLLLTLTGGLRLLGRSEDVGEAGSVARQVMERILARDYLYRGSDVVFDGQAPVRGFPPAPYPVYSGRVPYKIRVTLSALDLYRNRVFVDVLWSGNRSLRLEAVCLR